VAFSGGRDSSTVLAVATHVARRDGLPEPLPITRVFPGVPAAEETEWQEAVVGHLGLREWQRVPIGDELDLLGPLATARLLEHGVVWPPTIHVDIPLLEHLEGGWLLDGEGGDEVLGVADHRVAPLSRLVRRPSTLSSTRLRSALGAIAPHRRRAAYARRKYDEWPLGWLRPGARETLLDALSEFKAGQPLSFRASVRAVPEFKAQSMLARNRELLAERHGARVSSPLLHPDFVHALARSGGFLGRGDRTAMLRRLVPDLLPAAVLERRSKAEFGGAYMTHHTRAFADTWTGGGVDPELVDPEELHRMWLGGERNALTAALLQAAWLGSR
jgi:asparagine synthase (glutamine-hydrolysing)